MGYRWCKHCARGQCTWWRHWHIRCRLCGRYRIFHGPSCKPCRIETRALVADLVDEMLGDRHD